MLKNLIIILLSILVAVICGELIIRFCYHDKFGPRPIFYSADSELGWKSAPNLHHNFYGPDYKIAIATDEDGYRLGHLGEVDKSKDIIVLLGDSYTFGWGVNTDETFASFLDDSIDQASHHKARVINLGVGGYGTLQYAFRLKHLLSKYPKIKIKAVIINHCSNDLTDNLKSLGYHAGLWSMKVKEKERSRFHLVNFLNYLQKVYESRKENIKADKADNYLVDNLWDFQRDMPGGFPVQVVLDGNFISLAGLSPLDLDRNKNYYTDIQKNLFRAGVRMIDELLENQEVLIFHAFVYGTDDEYIQEVTSLIEESSQGKSKVIIFGRVPDEGSYSGAIENKHSGGHYNRDFNRFWAEAMMNYLEKEFFYN